MEIKNYLFKNFYTNQKENIAKKIIKRNKKEISNKDNIFNKKQESTTTLFRHHNSKNNNIFVNNKTNSSNNINVNNSSNFNSNYQSHSSEKKNLAQKKAGRTLNQNSRNFSQANKISLNNKKKILTSTSNTTATSLITNQINNYNKCITDRNIDDNKIKNININKNIGSGSQFLGKNKVGHNNKEIKDTQGNMIPKKTFYVGKKEINNNIAKNILKNKIQNKDTKYQLNYVDNNMNENILFKKKIKNFKNSNSKLNNNKLKNNVNLNENKNKLNKNVLNIKKLNFTNLPINFLDGKLIQGIMNLNSNNTNITEANVKKECNTDRPNYNYINSINSQMKNKEIINEQYNNINNNYIIANIINNIKLNNKKVKKKKISRNKSIKLSEKKNKIYNTNLTSLNLLLKNSNIKNYPSSLRIRTIDLSKINNNKTPSIDYNTSYNKRPFFENKNVNKRLFDINNLYMNKKNISHKRRNYCNLKIKKKGKNYKRLINVPLKLTKKNIFPKEKKFNLEMNFSNNTIGFDKLNLLTFNYIHSLNFNHKNESSLLQNRRKLSQGNYSDKYRNIFQLFQNNRNSVNESKRDSNYNSNKTDSNSNIIKNNLIHNIPKNSKVSSKYMNSLSNYETSSKEKDINKINNKENKNILYHSNININKLNEHNKKIFNKKNHSNSPFDINTLLKKGNKKSNNNNNNENNIQSKSKSRNISRNYKNNYLGFLNNESKTNVTKYKTNKTKILKSEKNSINNNEIVNNSKKRLKNLSVAINNINTSTKNNLDSINKEKEKIKQFSFNNIFYTEKNNVKNSKIENSNEQILISIKTNNSRNSLNKNIQSIKSVITVKEKNKNQNQSEFSKKSRNITIPINNQKNQTVINDEDSQTKILKDKKDKEKEKENNPLIVEEYFDEIIYSLLKEESEFISKELINHNYLLNEENEISPEMRAMVVDWLLEVHQIFHFQEKCLFTTIQIMDKYLSKKNISIDQFQLLALTALNISSKQEEVEYPILDNFITISKNTLTKKEMIDMENKVLTVIDYEILSPTMLDFFQIYAFVCNLNPVEFSQGLYLMNVILIDINMLKYKNSLLAFAVLEIIAKENKIKKLFKFLNEVNKKALYINENKSNVCQIIIKEINKEFNNNELANEIKYLFRTILKTHYHNAKNKFNNQNFYGVSSYTSI